MHEGEDVVAGIRTPLPIEEMRESMADAYEELVETPPGWRRTTGDDIEFTVEDGELFLPPDAAPGSALRPPHCGSRSMADERLISREEGVARIDPGQLDQLLHPMIDPQAEVEVAAKGLNASPGAASGAIVLDADTAEARGQAGEDVILVRWETTDDIHGLIQARGVLTAHGGMTSHAAWWPGDG